MHLEKRSQNSYRHINNMKAPRYKPVQIPQILDPAFSRSIAYREDYDARAGDFAICFWEMQPIGGSQTYAGNVIVADGCIDLVVLFSERRIGFSGMTETVYDYRIDASHKSMGVRLKPGAFSQLTGLPASRAMDAFLPLKDFDLAFDEEGFFSLSFDDAQRIFKDYMISLMEGKRPNEFVHLFDQLVDDIPSTASDLYGRLHFSPRQCQRLFMKHFGYSPQKALSILRFQHCLEILTSKEATPSELLGVAHYCDQSHCIKDFRKNIGLTPLELMAKYR